MNRFDRWITEISDDLACVGMTFIPDQTGELTTAADVSDLQDFVSGGGLLEGMKRAFANDSYRAERKTVQTELD
jgi:hypothetical protein